MIRRWLALTYYLYALRLAALSHFILIHYIGVVALIGTVAQYRVAVQRRCDKKCRLLFVCWKAACTLMAVG